MSLENLHNAIDDLLSGKVRDRAIMVNNDDRMGETAVLTRLVFHSDKPHIDCLNLDEITRDLPDFALTAVEQFVRFGKDTNSVVVFIFSNGKNEHPLIDKFYDIIIKGVEDGSKLILIAHDLDSDNDRSFSIRNKCVCV